MVLSRDDNSLDFHDLFGDCVHVPEPFEDVWLPASPQLEIYNELGNYSHVSGLEGHHIVGEPESPLNVTYNDILHSEESNFFQYASNDCFIYPSYKDTVWNAPSASPIDPPDPELKDQVSMLSEIEVPESSASCILTKTTYTPNNDHCYSQTRSCTPSETSDSETSGGEVDIETVPEEDMHIPFYAVEVQRPGAQLSGSVPHVKRKRGALTQRQRASYRVNHVQTRRQGQKGVARTKRGRRTALSAESSPCSSRTSSDTEEPEKRHMHNCMERLRRDHLREALHTLRMHVPTLEHDEKAAKVKILDLSTKYVHEITEESEQYEKTKKMLLRENKRLLKEYRALLRKYHTYPGNL